MNRGIANHTLHDSLRSKKPDPPRRSQRAIGAPDWADCKKPFLIDMPDNKSDLIRVGLQHDPRSLGIRSLQHSPRISVGIRVNPVRMRSHIFDPKPLTAFLPS